MNYNIPKPENMLCGSACLHYILNILYKCNLDIDHNLSWITDLAAYIKMYTNIKFTISCHNSNLYDDYLEIGKDSNFEGFRSITKFLSLGEIISDIPLSITGLSEGLNENSIFILNVSSSIFNQDNSLTGGHFICLVQETFNTFTILNPKSKTLAFEVVPKQHLINSIENFGSWCIKINRSEI